MHIYWHWTCRSRSISQMSTASEVAWIHWWFWVCLLLLPVPSFHLTLFIPSCTHFKSQNDCYKVCYTRSWLTYSCWRSLLTGMFHNKERDLTSDVWHWYLLGANWEGCQFILWTGFLLWANVSRPPFRVPVKTAVRINALTLQFVWSLLAHAWTEWSVKL